MNFYEGYNGNWMVKFVPIPSLLFTIIFPLWLEIIFWVTIKPRPVPSFLLVKKDCPI